MWISKKRWRKLEKRITVLERKVQRQSLEDIAISLANNVDNAVDSIFHTPEPFQEQNQSPNSTPDEIERGTNIHCHTNKTAPSGKPSCSKRAFLMAAERIKALYHA